MVSHAVYAIAQLSGAAFFTAFCASVMSKRLRGFLLNSVISFILE
jgi:hypothetical protein